MNDIIDLLEEPLNDVVGIRSVGVDTVAKISIALSLKRIADELTAISNADSVRVAGFIADVVRRLDEVKK